MDKSRIRATNYFIVEVESLYKDGVCTSSGVKIYAPIDYANTDLITTEGVVLAVPKKFQDQVNVGDRLIFDHNILRNIYAYTQGDVYKTPNHIAENICYIPTDEWSVYGYIRDGQIYGLNDSVFVEPIKDDGLEQVGSLVIKKETYKGYKLNTGVIVSDFHHGETILYSDYSEHKFIIDGKTLWRMQKSDIIAFL